MARFFISGSNIFGGIAYLSKQELDHIRVLRIRKGEVFTVCDGEGTDYVCRMSGDDPNAAEIISKSPSVGEPSVDCTVFAAFPKGDKADLIIQKCVEIGASRIVLFPSSRCVSQPDAKSLIKKLDRWQRIAFEASKQSERGAVCEVSSAVSFNAALADAARCDLSMLMYENERGTGIRSALLAHPEVKTVSVMTGPEGGFSEEEVKAASDAGLISVSLGSRILRCETAPICALTAVMLLTGNMGE